MTRVLEAEVAFPAQCELAEGPVWDAARGLLRWVDTLPGPPEHPVHHDRPGELHPRRPASPAPGR